MENASKALIMAGAILIAILLISVGIVLVNSSSGVVEQGKQASKIMEIQTFNNQFRAYEGQKRGSEVKDLINLVNASNATNSEHQIKIYSNTSTINNAQTYTVSTYTEDGINTSIDGILRFYTKTLAGTSTESEKGYINCIVVGSSSSLDDDEF